jgi:TatD DNase family protein
MEPPAGEAAASGRLSQGVGRSAYDIPDAHCHLADLDDPGAALDEAARAGVGPILAVSMSPADARAVLALRDAAPGRVLAGAGIHPSRVPRLDAASLDEEFETIAALAARCDFIGEIGLDFKDAADEAQRGRQRALLDRMLDLAARLRLPVNLHTRRADRELLECAERFTRESGLKVVLHWFTHSRPLALRCGAAGIFISAGPSILTDPAQAEVARAIAPDFLLVETDSPVSYAGRMARPAWAAEVAARLASLRGESLATLASLLRVNVTRWRGLC